MKQFAEDTLRAERCPEVVVDRCGGPDAVDETMGMAAAGTLSEHVRDRLRDLEHRHAATLAGLAQREAEVTALRQRIDYMRGEDGNALRQMQQALQDARRSQARSENAAAAIRRDLEQAHAKLRAAQPSAQELEEHLVTLSAALDATRADIERAAASRAWRYGHWLTRVASRMMLRRHRTDGALLAALERIENAQRSGLALPTAAARPDQAVRADDD